MSMATLCLPSALPMSFISFLSPDVACSVYSVLPIYTQCCHACSGVSSVMSSGCICPQQHMSQCPLTTRCPGISHCTHVYRCMHKMCCFAQPPAAAKAIGLGSTFRAGTGRGATGFSNFPNEYLPLQGDIRKLWLTPFNALGPACQFGIRTLNRFT